MAAITVKKRHTIRKSQISTLYKRLEEEIGGSASLFRADRVEKLETDSPITLYLIDRKPLLMEIGSFVFPTLRGAIEHPFQERVVVVDSGAVPFMVKGADVMRPGIVAIADDILADKPILIVEERYKKPLAVAIALMGTTDLKEQERGKVARNIHYVGDVIWNLDF